ncbi:MAG: hypothetical protein WAO19_11455 [Candidatus Kryptoniota bacterium]
MKKIGTISLPLLIVVSLAFASGADAQVRGIGKATATVTLTVLPAPVVNFASSKVAQGGVSVETGMSFDRSSNVMVQLKSAVNSGNSGAKFSPQSNTNIVTAKELRSASSVKIEYLGS